MDQPGAPFAQRAVTAEYCRMMARYGAWQNRSQLAAAARLNDAALRQDRGADYGSIQETLSHLLWSDTLWMARFAGTPATAVAPDEGILSLRDFDEFCEERYRLDGLILDWAESVRDSDMTEDLTFRSEAARRVLTRPWSTCVIHFFNHGTHCRGQLHVMLTAAGLAPGVTDIILMPSVI